MPRPPSDALAGIHEVDLGAVATPARDRLLMLMEQAIRTANGTGFRRRLMQDADFPSSDIPTFLALNQLSLHGALRPTDLAERLETGRANVSKIVARLQVMGLVVRVADPGDQRGVLVALTAAGRRIAERVVELQDADIADATAAWPAADVARFEELLERFLGGLDEGRAPGV
jgi:DNA-binding MarR family transcriptional regulator